MERKDMEVLYLSQREVRDVGMTMRECVDAVEAGLRAHAQGLTDMPPKSEILPRGSNFLHAMPCAIRGMAYCGIKWISGYFDNPAVNGLPGLMGMILLNDAETGKPLAILDCMEITILRTAAVSGCAVRRLVPDTARTACVIGCGNQGRANLEALHSEAPFISEVRAWNPHPEKAQRLCAQARERWQLDARPVGSLEEAVRGSDLLLVTAPGYTDDRAREIPAEWVKLGATVITVNHDASFLRGAVRQCADRVFVDDRAMFAWGKQNGFFDGIEEPTATLGELLTGQAPGRTSPQETIFSMPVGIAVDDLVCAARIYERALAAGLGTRLPL